MFIQMFAFFGLYYQLPIIIQYRRVHLLHTKECNKMHCLHLE